MNMKEFNVVIGENGRMIIPALFRKQLDLKPGDEVLVKLSADNEIIVHSPRQSLYKLQQIVTSKSEGSLVDAVIKMRRSEKI